MDGSEKYYAGWKKPDTKDHMLHDSIHRKVLEQEDISELEKTLGCKGLR